MLRTGESALPIADTSRQLCWDILHELERKHGPSFYLLDVQAFEENYREFLQAFRCYYPRSNLAYSYKTNYTPQLCRIVDALGGYAEVVSGMEYELALRIGASATRIIFNGPYKCDTDIRWALLAGSIVNLDSLYEVASVEEIAQSNPSTTLTVGLRCNFDIGSEQPSRLGFDVDGADFSTALERLRRLPNCRIAGLHCHYSTGHRSIESYALRTRTMLMLTARHFPDSPPQFINLGGGYFSKMHPDLKNQFGSRVPAYQDYAAAMATQVAQAFPRNNGPELILEPGSAITANVLQFVAKVVDVKEVRSRKIALAAGSIHNIKPTLHDKNLPLRVYGHPYGDRTRKISGPIDIVGYTCMEHDCLYKGYEGTLAMGDYAVFENTGAYTVVMKPPFIRACPPMLAYEHRSGQFSLIKRQEETKDVFATFLF